MVSITQGDEDDRGMEMFFSGQQVVSEVCEVSGHLKDGMTVEIIQGEFKGYRGRVRLGDGRFQVQLANGTKLQVGELQCRILEEDLHVLESEWKAEHLQHRCEGLVDAERTCSQDGCTVLLVPEVLSCEGYCQAHGIHCNQAWRSHGDSCHGATPATCAGEMRMRGDRLLCRCQALGLSRLGQEVPLNAHVLVDRHTGVVTKGPDHDGHVRVKMPKLLTLDRPFFRPWDADAAAQPRPWHGSCDELRQGDPVQLTEGHFRGHRGAVERCDPVSKQYTVILDQWLHVSAYNLVVLHCSALQPLGQNCSEDQCQIRPHSHRESCEQFCHAAEMRCFRAWRGQKGRCDMDQPLPCSAGAGTEKVCECAPDVYAGGNCFRHDLSYEPLNMPGQLRSHERSAKACAERCASVLGCAHFSYWSDGGCHLQDRHARLLGRPGVVVGPGDCLAAAARERPAEIGETDLCQAGVSYRPLDMDGQHRSHEPDLQHCAERCAAVAGCAHFSYWSDGGCHLQDSDAKEQSTLGAIAGHPKCQTDSGSSSATVRGVATTTTAPEEPGARASATARAAPSRAACAGLVDVVQYCSASKGCKATVRRMAQRSCFDYCEQLSSSCSRAFIGGCHGEEVDCDEITGSDAMTCHCHGGRADLRRSEAQELHQSQEEVQTWQFHCHEGSPKTWDMEKRWWCCRELEIGCGARSCWQAQHEGDWSMENRMWCCRAQQVGCDHEEVHHFDCSNGLRNWRNGWSPLKKKYCCKRETLGVGSGGVESIAIDAPRLRRDGGTGTEKSLRRAVTDTAGPTRPPSSAVRRLRIPRPGCTASCLASAPYWAWPCWLRARQLAQRAAEDFFDDFGSLWPETTVTVGWFPGAGLPVHTDNSQDYLSQRHVTVVVWLNEVDVDFQGGHFFFGSEPAIRPQQGSAAIFAADVPHGLQPVTQGLRISLNVWFSREPNASEDTRLLQRPFSWGTTAQRLWGLGPQEAWPPGDGHGKLLRHSLSSVKAPARGHRLGHRGVDGKKTPGRQLLRSLCRGPCPSSPKDVQRGGLMVAAFLRLFGRRGQRCCGSCLCRLVRRRERLVAKRLGLWHDQGLLSMPRFSPASCGCGSLERPLPGLLLKRQVVKKQEEVIRRSQRLLRRQNQAMRFGQLPHWAQRLARRCAPTPAFRVPYDQLIVNAYDPGEATMIFRRLSGGGRSAPAPCR
ncbi:unnamed protein product [Durusdinium trenchii]|uniref:Fe2OG dioxygenase domain-containing protein n=1 Tax=Durusdinium trenchii TaxID=1381693 RepID=A0ABP0H8U9_9DINO